MRAFSLFLITFSLFGGNARGEIEISDYRGVANVYWKQYLEKAKEEQEKKIECGSDATKIGSDAIKHDLEAAALSIKDKNMCDGRTDYLRASSRLEEMKRHCLEKMKDANGIVLKMAEVESKLKPCNKVTRRFSIPVSGVSGGGSSSTSTQAPKNDF